VDLTPSSALFEDVQPGGPDHHKLLQQQLFQVRCCAAQCKLLTPLTTTKSCFGSSCYEFNNKHARKI